MVREERITTGQDRSRLGSDQPLYRVVRKDASLLQLLHDSLLSRDLGIERRASPGTTNEEQETTTAVEQTHVNVEVEADAYLSELWKILRASGESICMEWIGSASLATRQGSTHDFNLRHAAGRMWLALTHVRGAYKPVGQRLRVSLESFCSIGCIG